MSESKVEKAGWASPVAALKHRNFRIWWFGQFASVIGTWMQNTAQGWLVLELTDSPFLLGLLTAVQFLPLLFLTLPAGVLADHISKKRLIIATQFTMMMLALILGFLIHFNVVRYWHVLVLSALLGSATAFDNPTRQSFFIDLVGKRDLTNAIALNSTSFNASRMIGPALGGFLIGKYGLEICFFINAASFLAVFTSLFFIRLTEEKKGKVRDTAMLVKIKEGLSYIKGSPFIRNILILTAVICIFAVNFNVLIPVLAREHLGLSAEGYGILLSATGIGSFLGAIFMAVISGFGPSYLLLAGGAFCLCFFQLLIYWLNSVTLLALNFVFVGIAYIIFIASVNSNLQFYASNEFRGRVMSIYILVFQGMVPLGSVISGTISQNWGAPAAFAFGAAAGLIGLVLLNLERKKAIQQE